MVPQPANCLSGTRGGNQVRVKLSAVVGGLVAGVAVLVSGCGSSAKNATSHTSTSSTSRGPALHAGQNPCLLVTAGRIDSTLKVHMTKIKSSKSSCTFTSSNGGTLTISTSKTTPAGAEAAVNSAAHTAKGKVVHLNGVGDSAIAYITTAKNGSIATGLVAKNGTLIFVSLSGRTPDHLLAGAIALAKAAAGNAA